jgi:hypothetical protein
MRAKEASNRTRECEDKSHVRYDKVNEEGINDGYKCEDSKVSNEYFI